MEGFKNDATTLEQWIIDNYERDEISDIYEHGIASGCGPIYTSDLLHLFEVYEEDIDAVITEAAENQGISFMELMSNLPSPWTVESTRDFRQSAAVVAIEELAYQISGREDDDDE